MNFYVIPGLCPVVMPCPHIISTGNTWPEKLLGLVDCGIDN